MAAPYTAHRMASELTSSTGVHRQCRDLLPESPGEQISGTWSLECDNPPVAALIVKRDVFGDHEIFDRFDKRARHLRLEFEQIGIGFSIHDKIGDEVPLSVQESRVASLTRLQALRIIRDHGMQKTLPFPSCDTNQTTM